MENGITRKEVYDEVGLGKMLLAIDTYFERSFAFSLVYMASYDGLATSLRP